MALGSALRALGFAFYKERSSRLFREPGEMQRLLHVRELGVIPAMENTGRLWVCRTAGATGLRVLEDGAMSQLGVLRADALGGSLLDRCGGLSQCDVQPD